MTDGASHFVSATLGVSFGARKWRHFWARFPGTVIMCFQGLCFGFPWMPDWVGNNYRKVFRCFGTLRGWAETGLREIADFDTTYGG